MHGIHQKSFLVHALSLQKSTQKCNIPSFSLTKTIALHHGDWLGCIPPVSNISQSEVHTSSSSGGGICLNHSLNGLLSVIQISCSTTLVQPSSLPSSVKISWKASMWSHATMAFQGVQLLRPSRFNFSRSFFCCSTTDRGPICPPSQEWLPTLGTTLWVGQVTQKPLLPSALPSSERLGIQTCF